MLATALNLETTIPENLSKDEIRLLMERYQPPPGIPRRVWPSISPSSTPRRWAVYNAGLGTWGGHGIKDYADAVAHADKENRRLAEWDKPISGKTTPVAEIPTPMAAVLATTPPALPMNSIEFRRRC